MSGPFEAKNHGLSPRVLKILLQGSHVVCCCDRIVRYEYLPFGQTKITFNHRVEKGNHHFVVCISGKK